MTADRRHPTVLLALLLLLVWAPGCLAGGTCPLMAKAAAAHSRVAPPCCPRNAEPALRTVDCCGHPPALAPAETAPTVQAPASLAPPAPSEPASAAPAIPSAPLPAVPLSPREGIPLYTLHATLLI
jgi:hypothetical protein